MVALLHPTETDQEVSLVVMGDPMGLRPRQVRVDIDIDIDVGFGAQDL